MEQFPISTKVKIIGEHAATGEHAEVRGYAPTEWNPLLWRPNRIWIRMDSGALRGTHLLVDRDQIELL